MSKKIKVFSDKGDVYLEVSDISECCFELWEVSDQKRSTVKIKIPMESWEKIIKKWQKGKISKKE